jgi:DNA-binding response OmpR family regulator/signal transduction histidine kinase
MVGAGQFFIYGLDPKKAITQYKLDTWPVEEGLPLHVVYAIQQTGNGFLWLGTRDGLVRFDGTRFKVYNQKNTPWLKSNMVPALYCDNWDNLWIGTSESGLCRLKDGVFTHYSPEEYPALKWINKLAGDRQGNVWIGAVNNGLSRLRDGHFTTYTAKDGLLSDTVTCILPGGDGGLLIGSPIGVTLMIPGGDNDYRIKPLYSFKWLHAACEKKNGETWFAANDGLYRRDALQVTRFPYPIHLPNLKIVHVCEDRDLNFWLGSENNGLIRLKQDRYEVFSKAHGLNSPDVYSIFEDREGSLWLGTIEDGLYRLRDVLFTMYTRREGLQNDVVNCIYQDGNGDILIGTDRGINRLKDDKFTLLFGGAANGADFTVYDMLEDRTGTLWMAGPSGLNHFKNGKLTQFTTKDGLSYNEVTALLEDRRGRLWAGTNNGLNQFSRGTFIRFNTTEGLVNPSVTCMYEDGKENVWIGTTKGLSKFHNGRFTNYTTQSGLPHNHIECIYEDSKGLVYIGTRGGICRLEKGTFFNYTSQHGLVTSRVNCILEDDRDNLWLAGPGGISRIEKKQLRDLAAGKITILTPRLYDEQDGLKTRWCGNAGYKSRDGKLWFGTDKGAVMLDPVKIKENTIPPPVVIDQLALDGQEIKIKGRQVIIPPGTQRIEIRYTATTFIKPREVKFKIKLKGFDNVWLDMNNVRLTNYTDLPPGEYTFQVIAANSDGVWNRKGASLDIYKKPFWYQTRWAYISFVFLLLVLILLFVKWRSWKLVREKKRLEQTVKDRTREIEEKNLQLEEQSEQLKELDEAKSRFFANISHEFRTPLTLIMGPLEQILSRNSEKEIKGKANLMLRNSRRLLNLINQLLELARLDSGKMKLEASGQNIVPFLRRNVMCFESLAEQNKVELIFMSKEDDIPLYFDPEKLEKIITNLLSNAFKYTPTQGTIAVTVQKDPGTGGFPSGCVEISVRDTGTGIPENQLQQIFDRFHRVEGSHEHKQKGSGIGLALTRELVELHHGQIEVQSSCREDHSRGTEFILRLPLGKEHLQPEEITAAVDPGKNSQLQELNEPGKPLPAHLYPDTPEEEQENEEALESLPVVSVSEPRKEKEEKPFILVVDDNADVRIYIKSALEPCFNVVEAADGNEGILRAKEIIPDLIVSDVMMPEADGYELCRTLKNDILTSHIPIILLTAKVSEQSELEGLATGADDYITKPFSTTLLKVRARNLIDLRRQLQLVRSNSMRLQPEQIPVSPIDDEFYKTLQDTVETHLSDPDFNAEALGRELQMSQATLWRKINALTGKTPLVFMRSHRLKRAAQLLSSSAVSVSEAADKVGFADRSYFSKCFKEQFNRLPSEFLPSGRTGPNDEEVHVDTVPAETNSPTGAAKQDKEVILVVEDNDDARNYIRESLEPEYQVVEAADGSEGIARAMEIIPDLVISDIMMPNTDGHELCRVLKKDVRTSHIPVVLLTAKASEESKIMGLETGADDYIIKPFNTDILITRIKNLIRLRSHLQKQRNREMTMLPAKISESQIDREFIKELNAVIKQNLVDPEFNVEQLAKKLYMSSATLYRKIQALSGEIPSEYIRSFRLQRAAQLFKQNFGSITEVAFEVGFNSRAYFTRCFKEKFHQLPSVFMAASGGQHAAAPHQNLR